MANSYVANKFRGVPLNTNVTQLQDGSSHIEKPMAETLKPDTFPQILVVRRSLGCPSVVHHPIRASVGWPIMSPMNR